MRWPSPPQSPLHFSGLSLSSRDRSCCYKTKMAKVIGAISRTKRETNELQTVSSTITNSAEVAKMWSVRYCSTRPLENFVPVWGSEGGLNELLILWLCNMKQLNFRHFNINSKKFTVAVTFSVFWKETEWAAIWPFCNNSRKFQDFRRLPKTDEVVRRLQKISIKISEICFGLRPVKEMVIPFRIPTAAAWRCSNSPFFHWKYAVIDRFG